MQPSSGSLMDGHRKAVEVQKNGAQGLLNESCLWCYQHRRLHIFFSVKKNDVFFRGSVDVNQKWSSAGLFEKLCCLESNSGDGKDETPPAVSRHRFSSGIETLSGVRLFTLALIEQAHLCINTYMHRKTGLVQPSGQRSVLDKQNKLQVWAL